MVRKQPLSTNFSGMIMNQALAVARERRDGAVTPLHVLLVLTGANAIDPLFDGIAHITSIQLDIIKTLDRDFEDANSRSEAILVPLELRKILAPADGLDTRAAPIRALAILLRNYPEQLGPVLSRTARVSQRSP